MSRLPIAVLFLLAPVASQSYITSPKGFLFVEGNSSTWIFGAYPGSRHMILDGELRGTQRTLKEVAFRLDFRRHGPDSLGRSWKNVTIKMSTCDAKQANRVFSQNPTSTPTQVFASGVTWASFQGVPPQVPSRWGGPNRTLRFPFASNYVYTGKHDLCVDYDFSGGRLVNNAEWHPNKARGYGLDSCSANQQEMAWQVAYGHSGHAGCQDPQAPNRTSGWARLDWSAIGRHHPSKAWAGTHTARAWTLYTAKQAPVVYAIGLRGNRAGVAVPGVACNRLYVDVTGPTVYRTVLSNDRGLASVHASGIPASRVVPGMQLWFQAAWQNSKSGAMLLTNAATISVPKNPDAYVRAAIVQPDPWQQWIGSRYLAASRAIPVARYAY